MAIGISLKLEKLKRITLYALFFIGILSCGNAVATPGHDAIKGLGELNGTALACRYLDEVNRMKAAVVANAPKERSYGLAFEEGTDKGFKAFINERRSCPGKPGFSLQVDEAIIQIEHAFDGDR